MIVPYSKKKGAFEKRPFFMGLTDLAGSYGKDPKAKLKAQSKDQIPIPNETLPLLVGALFSGLALSLALNFELISDEHPFAGKVS